LDVSSGLASISHCPIDLGNHHFRLGLIFNQELFTLMGDHLNRAEKAAGEVNL